MTPGWLGRLAGSVLGNPADRFSYRTDALIALFDGNVETGQEVRRYEVVRTPVEVSTVVVAPAAADLLYRPTAPAPKLRHAFYADTAEHWNDGVAVGVVRLAFVARRADVEPSVFRARYEAHAEIAREHHPGIVRYVQHRVRRGTHPDVAAIAELHFESDDAMKERFYRDETSADVVAADIADYLDRERTWSMIIRPCG